MKKEATISIAALVCAAVLGSSAPSLADRTAPADETATGDRLQQIEAELQRMRDENAAREARDAAAAKKAADARKRAAEQRAREQRAAAERARKAAEEKAFSDALGRGVQFIADGRYRDGLKAMRDFAKAHPYSADAWYWIAVAHNALGDYDRAQYAVNIALEIDPYYEALTKSPSGLEPRRVLDRQGRKEPRPSMSVLPVKPVLPANLALEPVTITFPYLRYGGKVSPEDDRTDPLAPRRYDGRDPVSGAYLDYLPYPPLERGVTKLWMQDEQFNEISRWRFRVDRMGMLKDPKTPIAWRGSYPYEVYFWTGSEWARAKRTRVYYDHKESFDDTLGRAQESIRELLDARGWRWAEADTPSLAAYASHMGYKWMGEIDVEPAHKRDEELARRHFIYDTWDDWDERVKRSGGSDNGGEERSEPASAPSEPSEPTDDGYY